MSDIANKALLKQFESEYYVYDYIYTYRSFNSFGKPTCYDFCILTEKSSDKKVIRFQKRFWGISKKMRDEGIKAPRWIITDNITSIPRKIFHPFLMS